MFQEATAVSEIDEYWDKRSETYSTNTRNELDTKTRDAWADVLKTHIPAFGQATLRVLDIGCGPGFFSILCAENGCLVDAIDGSTDMLAQATANAQRYEETTGRIRFHQGDVQALDFMDNTFDTIVTRNVTWTLPDPHAAYAEWHRVLKPGGRLLNFDANWYSYLVDHDTDLQRQMDQRDIRMLGRAEDARASEAQCSHCEQIALRMPLTYCNRPSWDVCTLGNIGFAEIAIHDEISQTVWTPQEQAFYRSCPLFMIVGTK